MKLRRCILLFLFFNLGVLVVSQNLFFERIAAPFETPSTPVHGIAKDSVGYIWFGSWNGVYRYDGKSFDLYRHKPGDPYSLPNNRIRNIITDQNKSLWMYTFDRRYVKYNYSLDRFETIPDSLIPNIVVSLLNSSHNQLNRNTVIDGKRYFLSSHQLTEQDVQTSVTWQYTVEPNKPGGLRDAYITSFYIDDRQIIWIGARNGDIYKANTNRKPFNLHYCYGINDWSRLLVSPRALLKRENELWIGTNNNGIVIYNENNLVEEHPFYRANSQRNQIRTLLSDRNGEIWIGSVNGLERYYPAENKCVTLIDRTTHPDLDAWSVFALEESASHIWAGLYNGMAQIRKSDNHIKIIGLQELVDNHSVMDAHIDRDGYIWLATEGNGLIRLTVDAEGSLRDTLLYNSIQSDKNRIITGDMVYSIYEDARGNIWAGTTEGLFCIEVNTSHIKHFSSEQGLAENYISAVTGDRQGNIWISHKKGISKLEVGNYNISNYRISDQNRNWVFLDGACFMDSVSNRIFFGAREGYVSFSPERIKANPYKPSLVLKSFYLSGKRVDPMEKNNGNQTLNKSLFQTNSIDLDFSNRNFAIEMAALHYENPDDNVFQYMLEGYNDDWVSSSENKVTYTKVPPGKYTFKARALSPDNVSSDLVSLQINVHAPWFASRWALIGYVFIAFLVLFLINRVLLYREKLKNQLEIERIKSEKQEELNKQKLEFFTNVSHELRTPLTLITDPIKQLEKDKLDAENRSVYFSMINRNVNRLTELINQLLDFRKMELGKLPVQYGVEDAIELIRDTLKTFELKAKERNILLNFNSDAMEIIGYFDKDKLRQIVSNLLSNALKYTDKGGKVSVTVARHSSINQLSLTISDNGIGISRKALKLIFEPFNNEGAKPFYGYSSGMGLALTHKLVEILNGEISIESYPQKGTAVKVTLPFETPDQTGVNARKDKVLEEEDIPDKRPVVLIVEDSLDVQTYLKSELGNTYIILSEGNGLDGLKTALKNIPDLIVSDVMMPKMDGIELCREVKNNEQTSHIPVIMLTAKTADENRIQGLETGADAYIAKPFNIDVLKAQMGSIIDNRRKLRAKLAGARYVSELKTGENISDNNFLDKVIRIINQNIENPDFNPEALAQELKISRRQLYRKLQAVSGSAVQDFIKRVRMEKAASLLLEGNMNVSEIAYRLGFSEPSNFSRTFSRHFGCSPTKYIRQNKKGAD